MKYLCLLICSLVILSEGCRNEQVSTMAVQHLSKDPHSYAEPGRIVTSHLSLDLNVDFENQQLQGTATHTLRHHGGDTFIVDIKGLNISEVMVDDSDAPVNVVFTAEDPVLGRGLKIPVSGKTEVVTIRFSVPSTAAALGWLTPEQTAGKRASFLYTQGQAILTRTWLPIQDSPGIRFTYDARVRVPTGMMAAMSATNPQERSPDGQYMFRMEYPVPGYLIALSVGDFSFTAISERTGVYAEPPLLDAAKYEFADMDKMVAIAEELYGPYRWDRYDVIILPPSFPFGGMENPKLTFATPTIIAGDRSLVSLIAHELAHSWSGNLVTNATWNDFWLNEGFTTYFEYRIMEALYGHEYAAMLQLLGYQDLQKTVNDLGKTHEDTHLFLDLHGRDPDDGMTSIAYEKGAFFLRRLEEAAGREVFDAFLRKYFHEHQFQSMSTARFVLYLEEHLLKPENLDIDIEAWIYGPGIPPDAPQILSDRFEKVEESVHAFANGDPANQLPVDSWTTHEWLHFIRHLPKDLNASRMHQLDEAFNFSSTGNYEIAAAWYELALRNIPADGGAGYADVILPRIEEFLVVVGRRKFLMPLYRAMKENQRLEEAQRIFTAAKQNYHSVSAASVAELLGV